MSITEFRDIKDVISRIFPNQRINDNLINILMYKCQISIPEEFQNGNKHKCHNIIIYTQKPNEQIYLMFYSLKIVFFEKSSNA